MPRAHYPFPSALTVLSPTRIGRSGHLKAAPRQSQAASQTTSCHAHFCVRQRHWPSAKLIPERAAAGPLLAHGKVSCTALRLVYDPAGTGSWVRPRRGGERLGADASSTVGAVVLKAATAMHTLAPMARDSPTLLAHRPFG